MKGNAFERDVAHAIRPWFPDACRAVRNTNPDPGDIAETAPSLFWSLKDDKHGHNSPPGVIAGWYAEAVSKADGRIPVIVQKRPGQAAPLLSWAWICHVDYQLMLGCVPSFSPRPEGLLRMELRDLLAVMAFSNHARTPRSEVA
jgi:hypothetical protein